MGRTRDLSFVLWSALAGPALAAPACGNDGTHHLADAPAAGGPVAQYSSLVVAGTSECGDVAPATVDLGITNAGTSDLVISAATADGGFTILTTLPLAISAGQQAAITVRPPAGVVGTDLAGTTKTGTLSLTTNEASPTATSVALQTMVTGANIALTDSAGQALTGVTLDTDDGTCPQPLAVFITNTGTESAFVMTSAASHFAFTGFASGDVSVGMTAQQIRPVIDNIDDCADSEIVQYVVTGPICTATNLALPAAYNLMGSTSCFCS